MARSVITLYDLPSKSPCSSWSLNPLKTRMYLNFKDIPYQTEWVEYPDIAGKFQAFHIPANATGTAIADFTIPAINLPGNNPEYLMGSKAIVKTLETLYRSPAVHLDSPILPKVEALITKIQTVATPNITPKVPRVLLNPRSAEYFEETRKKKFGMPLSELEATKGGEQAWLDAAPALAELSDLLNETEGVYFMGDQVSYADFVVVSFFHFYKRVSEEAFEKVTGIDSAFGALYAACAPYLARADH